MHTLVRHDLQTHDDGERQAINECKSRKPAANLMTAIRVIVVSDPIDYPHECISISRLETIVETHSERKGTQERMCGMRATGITVELTLFSVFFYYLI